MYSIHGIQGWGGCGPRFQKNTILARTLAVVKMERGIRQLGDAFLNLSVILNRHFQESVTEIDDHIE